MISLHDALPISCLVIAIVALILSVRMRRADQRAKRDELRQRMAPTTRPAHLARPMTSAEELRRNLRGFRSGNLSA
jgi:hypothetical protein